MQIPVSVLLRTCLAFLAIGQLSAAELQPADLFPATTVAYAEISDPKALLDEVLDHPLTQHIQTLDVYRKATESQGYRNFLTGRKLFELQIGTDWRPAFEAISARGIYVGFDASTQGAAVLIRGKDEATVENFRTKILELSRLNGTKVKEADEYRGITVYKLDQGGAAAVRDWVVVTNNGDLGKSILDRLLSEESVAGESLADSELFVAAHQKKPAEAQLWSFINLKSVRDAGGARKMLEGQAENPLAELLLGGIQSILQKSDWVTSDLTVETSGLAWKFATPFDPAWIPEQRSYFFGPDTHGHAPSLPQIDETLLTVAAYRDVSAMWLRAGDLFNEEMNEKLAEADAGLSTVFAGRDFGEEILGSFAPEIGIIVTRQSFEDVTPTPAIRLPAFAVVLKLRDPETMRSELRRTFQSAIGFFNIVGAQNGQPQLEMDMQKVGDTDLITSRYLPEKKDKDSPSAPIIFNFSPSVSFTGDRFVLASTATLARQLGTAPVQDARAANTSVALNAAVLRETLADNREQLISQNMLEEGHTREEAEAAIELLLEIVRCFRGAGLELNAADNELQLNLTIDVNEPPR